MKHALVLFLGLFLISGTSAFAALSDGLLASYPFNGNANDESGNGNDGTVSGATLTTDRFGNADSAYSFNSANEDHIVVNAISGLTATQTRSVWIYPDYPGVITNFTYVLDEGNSPPEFNNNWIELISNRVRAGTDESHFGDTSTTVDARDWTHIAVTSEIGGDIIVYIDAVPEIVATAGTNMPSDIRIGGTMSPFEHDIHFNGKIDDIRFYDRVLSESEIRQLATIPIPAALPLFTTALAGLGAMAWRRQRKAAWQRAVSQQHSLAKR
jgi:hypothetical protein